MAYYPFATELGARYTLISPDGAIAVFNDPFDPNYVGMATEVVGLDSPDVRESATELVEGDGGTHGNFYFGRRPISITAKVFGHNTVAQRNAKLDRARRAAYALRGDATLSWKPSVRWENLVTNPRAQNNTTDWSAAVAGVVNAGATITQATGVAPAVGTTAIQVATSGAGNATQGAAIGVPVTIGRTYSVSVQARRTVGTDTYNIGVNGAGTATLATAASAGAFTTYTGSFVAASTGTAYVRISGTSTNTLASTFQITDVLVSPGTDTTYRDGDTSGYYWQGDQGNSASGDYIEMFALVRRQQPFRESGAWNKDIQIALVSANAFLLSTGLKTVAAGVAAENRGSGPAYPLINVTGASSNPSVSDGTKTLVTTGLSAGTALAAGETIQFDTLNHTAKFTAGARNGQSANRFIDYSATRWPCLSPAASTTFTLSGGGTATIQYRDTWV